NVPLAWNCSSDHRNLKVLTCCSRSRHALSTWPSVTESSATAWCEPKTKMPRAMTGREAALLAGDVRQTGIAFIVWSPGGLERKVWILDHRLRFSAGLRPEWQV